MDRRFAIKDEVSGEYLLYGTPDWGPPSKNVATYARHLDACDALAMRSDGRRPEWARETARIVPAPPPVLTDAEVRQWFRSFGRRWSLVLLGDENGWHINGRGVGNFTGDSIENAMREAHRKLEGS